MIDLISLFLFAADLMPYLYLGLGIGISLWGAYILAKLIKPLTCVFL